MHSIPNIVRTVASRRARQKGHVGYPACVVTNSYNLVQKSEETNYLEDLRVHGRILRRIRRENVDRIPLSQERDQEGFLYTR